MKVRLIFVTAALALATACVPQPETPTQPQQPAPQPQPPTPPPPPASADWRDIPLTQGEWFYSADPAGGSVARFGTTASQALFVIRCERSRQVHLSVAGGVQGPITIRTSFGARSLPVVQQGGATPLSTATIAASDPFLDGMAFSRGRYTVEANGRTMLVLPAWAETARVIEDCRS